MIRKLSICILLSLFFLQKISAKVYRIGSEQEFKAVQSLLIPGDEVVIKNGNYKDWSISINNKGTLVKPIIIQAEKQGMVIFSGNVTKPIFSVSGEYVFIKGINFKDCVLTKTGVLIELATSNN